MKIVPFAAENTEAALAQIHAQLGPDAVVLGVRRLPTHGLARLWNRQGRVEMLAAVLSEQEEPVETPAVPDAGSLSHGPRPWRSLNWLESLGLWPEFADRVEERVHARHGAAPPPSPHAEWTAVRETLAGFWRPAPENDRGSRRPHVFVGPAGSGKTTALCKWLTGAVLTQEQRAQVWRLDGAQPNTSELLSVHCELLGVPVARSWYEPNGAPDAHFVDLPGVDVGDADAFGALRQQLAALPAPRLHLVLNAAYETAVLFEQVQAFATLRPDDLIFTHLDEERQRVKLWNFVLGTNCPLSFLSAGQRIPGEFFRAGPAQLFPDEKRPSTRRFPAPAAPAAGAGNCSAKSASSA